MNIGQAKEAISPDGKVTDPKLAKYVTLTKKKENIKDRNKVAHAIDKEEGEQGESN